MAGRVRKMLKNNFNLLDWVGARFLADSSKSILSLVKKLVSPSQPQGSETFEEALLRLKLTEDDIKQRIRDFKHLVMAFFAMAVVIYFYAIHLLWLGSYMSAMATLSLLLLALAQAFRYHFWLFQIKKRKLGCSFDEWFQQIVLGKKS